MEPPQAIVVFVSATIGCIEISQMRWCSTAINFSAFFLRLITPNNIMYLAAPSALDIPGLS